METTVTEVGTASLLLREREVCEREGELRQTDRQRVRAETGKCETDFRECTAEFLFSSWRISLDSCNTIIRLLRAGALNRETLQST